MQQSPAALGLELANWYWKAVRQFVMESFGASLSRSSCLNWLHRLGFAFKRPKKRLLKADEEKRAAFVAEYAAMWEESQGQGPGYSSLTRPTSGRTRSCGGSGCSRENLPWWTPPVPATGRRPATTQRYAWRRGRWNGWNWVATATRAPRLPS